MPATARKTRRALVTPGRLTEAQMSRLLAFPYVRRSISKGLERERPIKVDFPRTGNMVHFRMRDPAKFHKALYATMPVGRRGTLLVVGTPLSQVRKPRELANYLRAKGWNPRTKKWKRRLSRFEYRNMIYQLRSAGVIGGARTQAVLVSRARVDRAIAPFLARREVRSAIGAAANPLLATLGFNPRGRAAKNDPAGRVAIRIPFRNGQKIPTERLRNWVNSLPPGPMKARYVAGFNKVVAQHLRFHKVLPNTLTLKLVPVGASDNVTDIGFGVGEGKEWAATYQVPKDSGKYDPKVQGRYIHSHGESGIQVNIRRPASRKKLPDRFHTADGSFVGVLPSRNVKIRDWYYG